MNAEKPKMDIHNYKTLDRNNSYFLHIQECQRKVYPPGTLLHKHHIIPEYIFNHPDATAADLEYKDSPENLVLLSIEDHIIAHELLYQIYGNEKDRGAVLLLKGSNIEAAKIWKQEGAKASHQVQQDAEKQFWNQEFQKEMARRSLQRADAIEIRSKGGKKGGKTTKMDVAIQPHHRYVFSFENTEVVCILNCSTGTEVLEVLQQIKETKLARVTPLLKGERKRLHGWSCKRLEDGGVLEQKFLDTLRGQVLGIIQVKS